MGSGNYTGRRHKGYLASRQVHRTGGGDNLMANALVTLVDQQVVVQVFGAALLDDMVQRAEDAADRAEIAAGVAISGLNHLIYDTVEDGEDATAVDDYFLVNTGSGSFQE